MKLRRTGRSITFGNSRRKYPLYEATVARVINLTKDDCDHSTQLDPYGCAVAVAVKRINASPDAKISPTVAYSVETYRGKLVAVKHYIHGASRRLIQKFDMTGKMPAEGIYLSPVPKHRTVEARRALGYKDPRVGKGKRKPAKYRRTFKRQSFRPQEHLRLG